MANPSQRTNSGRGWYSVSVESIRLWTGVLLTAAIGIGAFLGYGYLKRHLAEKEALVAAEDSRRLLSSLRTENAVMQQARYRDKYDRAVDLLGDAEDLIAGGEFQQALPKAEASRGLATSIFDSLRNRDLDGEAEVITVFGNVEVRRGDEGDWLAARKQDSLEPGDWVRTNANASAVLMFSDGNLFTVRPSTVILIESRRRTASGTAEQTISLEYGWVNMSTSESESRVVTPRAEALVAKQSDGSVVYNDEEGKTRFAAYEGEIDVTTDDGQQRTVTSMQQIVQTENSLRGPTDILRAPLLLGPKNNHDTDLVDEELTLSWDAVPGATGYALQVSPNSLFVENVIDVEERDKTSARIGLRRDGNFHWHVAAHGSDGELGEWSEARKFRVNEGSVTVGAAPGG